MKDRNFILICIGALLIAYLGNKVILTRSNDVIHENEVSILQYKLDSLKTSYIDLYNYTKGIESICDSSKTSRDRKEAYHKRMPNYENLFE